MYEAFSYRLDGSQSYPRLFWPRPKKLPNSNFGDALAYDVVNRFAEQHPSKLQIFLGPAKRRQLFSIGSVLHFARSRDAVWGSGIHFEVHEQSKIQIPPGINFFAVRGEYTREFLRGAGYDLDVPMGDPGLLVDLTLLSSPREKASEVRILPNHSHEKDFRLDPRFISPLSDWRRVAQEIAQTKLLVTSSLHGAVFADALGVPRLLFRFPGSNGLKFADYESGLSSTLRSKIFTDPAAAMRASPTLVGHDLVENARNRLARCFPKNLDVIVPNR